MYRLFFKRVIDFSVALIALIALSPLLLIVMLWLTIANGGKVFFTQQRPGKNEKIFQVIKFRSMNEKRDASGNLLADRERLTMAGQFIRKTSIDELPQLFNVLKGDMSLIGPRPLLIRYLPYYTLRERMRHTVRPGITGLAQVSGRNALDWNTKFELDARYVEHIAFVSDLRILSLTIMKVLKRDGVIADKKENYFDIERLNRKI